MSETSETVLRPSVALSSRKLAPVTKLETHVAQIEAALSVAARLNKIEVRGARAFANAINGVFSLAQYQSPFKQQNDRGTCWAFAGAAALEAAYKRKFGLDIDVAEEYVFHMGKAFALNRDAQNNVLRPVENNTSLTGAQGSGDIVKKLTENAAPPEETAPYVQSQQALLDILPVLGFANQQALKKQEDFDAIEFCEQHIKLLARVNARYRASDWASLGQNPSIEALENTLLANHEVVCDVTHKVPNVGGHCLLLIGFDRNRKVFFAKNHWGENKFIEIQYANDPAFSLDAGWYIKDVVDPKFVQNEACWLGNWWVTMGGSTFRTLLRRSEDFPSPGAVTKLGSAYLHDGVHDVNGQFLNNGAHIRFFVAPSTAPIPPGTLSGTQVDATLDFADVYNQSGSNAAGQHVSMSRFATRFAALFEKDDGTPWQARHGIDSGTYQETFDKFLAQGFTLTSVVGYSEGRDARFNAVWRKESPSTWQARHNLTAQQYQTAFDDFLRRGFRPTAVSGYSINGEARFAAIFVQRPGPALQARHNLTKAEYQQTFDTMAAQGFVLLQVCGYRVDVDIRFAAIWEKQTGITFEGHHNLTSGEYQKTFDRLLGLGFRLSCVNGYTDTGIARFAGVWRKEPSGPWQARHGLDAVGYQRTFDGLVGQGFRPVQVSGYGDGFYAA
jgi:Bacterial tandem repeat domain 1